ncbi:MAG: hypothetical protein M1356_10440 [Gammaproteobacteria bacterium]|nr:hypothetical protein [Gammaproteobacteria bacterium]
MQNRRGKLATFFTMCYQYLFKPALLGLIVAAIVLTFMQFRDQNPTPAEPVASSDLISFSSAFENAAPAVVNIYTTQSVREARFSGRPTTVMRLGSGIIMDPRGYILTALHVVQDVDEIQVALQDSRIFGARTSNTH